MSKRLPISPASDRESHGDYSGSTASSPAIPLDFHRRDADTGRDGRRVYVELQAARARIPRMPEKAREGARNPHALSPTSTGDEVANRRNELLDVRHLDAVRRVWKDDQLGAADVAAHLPSDGGREERILAGGHDQGGAIDCVEDLESERR